MMPDDGSILLVCVSCRAPGSDPAAPRPGRALLDGVEAAAAGQPTRVQGVACLSGCKRPCAAALLGPGRVTYLFGDLLADAASATQLLEAARDHARAPDGWLPRTCRPPRLRASILARVPPLHWMPSAPGSVIAWP